MKRLLLCLLLIPSTSSAAGADAHAVRLDKTITSRWQFGVEISSSGGAITGIAATLPVPMDWPEQKVRIVDESASPGVKVTYRVVDDAVKQMLVSVVEISAGETAQAVVTFEIEKSWIEAPISVDELRIPKTSRTLARYLTASPYIETTNAAIRKQSAEFTRDDHDAWLQTKTIFDWVRANVKYKFAEEIKPAAEALKAGQGDCEELSSLFIAFCRNNKIPARAVWVPGHTYPEFYLEDSQGKGHWYPCQAAGEAADFGRMPEDRPILQKGDNLKIPGQSKPQRYAMQTLTAKSAASAPQVKFIIQRLEQADK